MHMHYMKMSGNVMQQQKPGTAWGVTKEAWSELGLTDLNGGWTMRFDFSYPSTQPQGDPEWFYIMFNRRSNEGYLPNVWENEYRPMQDTDCDLRIALAPGKLSRAKSTYVHEDVAVLKKPANLNYPWHDGALAGHPDTPFTWLISRDGSNGYMNVKLYRRDVSELKLEVEIQKNITFDYDIPVAFYLNDVYTDYQAVGAVESKNIPSNADACNTR